MTFLSAQYEPLRRYLYGIFGSLLAVAAVYGFVTQEQALAIGAVIAAACLVPAVEAARAKVTPVAKHRA